MCGQRLRFLFWQPMRKRVFICQGHNSFVKAEDDMTDLCVYHARRYEIEGDSLYDPNRHAMIMQVQYNEDGFPVFEYGDTSKTDCIL